MGSVLVTPSMRFWRAVSCRRAVYNMSRGGAIVRCDDIVVTGVTEMVSAHE